LLTKDLFFISDATQPFAGDARTNMLHGTIISTETVFPLKPSGLTNPCDT
jgi:hypothetical protein